MHYDSIIIICNKEVASSSPRRKSTLTDIALGGRKTNSAGRRVN